MAEDSDDKTEDATERKLSQARDEGQVPQSQELKVWASLIAALSVLSLMAPGMARDVRDLLLPLVERPHTFAMDSGALQRMMVDFGIGTIKVLLPPMGVIIAFALAVSYFQHGFLFVPKRIMPEFSKISPKKGIERLFSLRQLLELPKSLIKLILVGSVMAWVLWGRMAEFATLGALDLVGLLAYLHDRVLGMVLMLVIFVTAIAAADWFYQKWDFDQKMKMTKQEVKDEHKQSEGDPMVKSRLRALRMQRSRQRMMQAVPEADVVVTNPTHFAVALKYDMETMNAPVLVAKGADLVAKRIRELADEHEVPIVENPPLARALYAAVELDQEVPQEHYKAVAEVIGYVMRLKGKLAH